MSAKGQIFSLDFISACAIFLVALLIIYIYWGYATLQIEETALINDMIKKANFASDLWFVEGMPKYWDTSNLIELGLQSDHSFNTTKMNMMKSLPYGKVLSMAGAGSYYLYYKVFNETNDILFEFGVYPTGSSNSIKVKRVGIMNDTLALVEVIIWL